jgi:hypothetical protein
VFTHLIPSSEFPLNLHPEQPINTSKNHPNSILDMLQPERLDHGILLSAAAAAAGDGRTDGVCFKLTLTFFFETLSRSRFGIVNPLLICNHFSLITFPPLNHTNVDEPTTKIYVNPRCC